MTSSGPSPSSGRSGGSDESTGYADRVFRSGANVFWGVLMLAVAAWLSVDAMLKSDAHTVGAVLAGLAFAVPLVVAFLLRPAVYANEDRLRIRNPFRTIVLPWGAVDAIRTGYTSEVLAGGAKYQLWAVPVSLRQRKRAVRTQAKATASGELHTGRAPLGRPSRGGDSHVASSDQRVIDLQDLAERNAARPAAQGEASVRWAYEIVVPCVAGLIALVVLLAV
ncbi:PH domain-containing protein [Streptomyces sp. CA-294286]|uniref:PH domain-containing protein n=1 Tax=Streptomyces sp. CA-294286 TaxID=3240070 RepID=UPI003D8D296A